MICGGCDKEAYHVRSFYDKGHVYDVCNNCSGITMIDTYVPDVFFDGKQTKFANLCDDKGQPYEIRSKRHKKEVMDRLGVSEAGDRVNGAEYGTKSWAEGSRDYRRKQFDKDRPIIRETYKKYLENVRRKQRI